MTNELTDQLLAMPTAPAVAQRPTDPRDFTSDITVTGTKVDGTINGPVGTVNEGTALAFLEQENLNPAEWEATHFRKITYGVGMESVKFSYKRIAGPGAGNLDIDDLVSLAKAQSKAGSLPGGDRAYVVALGDMQFGKIDGDGVDGALARCIDYLDRSRDLLEVQRQRFDIGHVHVAWLGDHIEGFNSQGGANVWRTQLTLNEQIRLTRRVMYHALELFHDGAEKVSMAAVPGNHGETQRFSGKGITRYDDSHDTESLIAVSEAAAMNEAAYGHVKFYVPTEDEMTVVLDLAGTLTGHAHGHQWRVGKTFDWWSGQAFGRSPLRDATLLLSGHLHHEHIESSGKRLAVQVPSLESESTWWLHAKGVPGNPGITTLVTANGHTSPIEIIR